MPYKCPNFLISSKNIFKCSFSWITKSSPALEFFKHNKVKSEGKTELLFMFICTTEPAVINLYAITTYKGQKLSDQMKGGTDPDKITNCYKTNLSEPK